MSFFFEEEEGKKKRKKKVRRKFFLTPDRPFSLSSNCSTHRVPSTHRLPSLSQASQDLNLRSYLPQQVDRGVGGAPGAHVAGERERRRRAGEDPLGVEVADVDLDGGVVLGRDELVGPRAGWLVWGGSWRERGSERGKVDGR